MEHGSTGAISHRGLPPITWTRGGGDERERWRMGIADLGRPVDIEVEWDALPLQEVAWFQETCRVEARESGRVGIACGALMTSTAADILPSGAAAVTDYEAEVIRDALEDLADQPPAERDAGRAAPSPVPAVPAVTRRTARFAPTLRVEPAKLTVAIPVRGRVEREQFRAEVTVAWEEIDPPDGHVPGMFMDAPCEGAVDLRGREDWYADEFPPFWVPSPGRHDHVDRGLVRHHGGIAAARAALVEGDLVRRMAYCRGEWSYRLLTVTARSGSFDAISSMIRVRTERASYEEQVAGETEEELIEEALDELEARIASTLTID